MNDCEIELVRRSASAVIWSVKRPSLTASSTGFAVATFAGPADQSELFQIAQGPLDIAEIRGVCRRSCSLCGARSPNARFDRDGPRKKSPAGAGPLSQFDKFIRDIAASQSVGGPSSSGVGRLVGFG